MVGYLVFGFLFLDSLFYIGAAVKISWVINRKRWEENFIQYLLVFNIIKAPNFLSWNTYTKFSQNPL